MTAPDGKLPMTAGRAFAALAVMTTVVITPILVGVYVDGSIIMKITSAFAAFSALFLFGAIVLSALVGNVDTQRPGRMPPADMGGQSFDPGPDDPVHYVAWEERGRGCQDPEPHAAHRWYWQADMPYRVGQHLDGTPAYATAPVRGSLPCHGRQP